MTIEEVRNKYPEETRTLTDKQVTEYIAVAERFAEAFLILVDKEAFYG